MPWPETTVPKFGEWDGNEDLSYSIVFDKARADKERYLPASKNDLKDSSLNQERYKTGGLIAGKGAPQTTANRIMEIGSRGSGQSSPNMISRNNYRSANDQKTFHSIRGDQSDTSERGSVYSSSLGSSGQQTMPMAREMVAHANGSSLYAPHEGRGQRVPGPIRQMHHEYHPATKITRSHGSSETSSIADTPEKIIVPKFGDWDTDDAKAGEGFTVIFDRARDEKKSKVARKTPARFISPLRPADDLYKDSQVRKKRGGWFNALCCADIGE